MGNPKIRTRRHEWHSCKRCDYRFDKSKAKCPSCGFWNTPLSVVGSNGNEDETMLLSEVTKNQIQYITNTGPWDLVFSDPGGIACQSTTLIAGEPGAGKSTMALQLSDRIAEVTNNEILYVSAEESKEQVKSRAERLKLRNLNRMRVYPMGASSDLGAIMQRRKPSAIIVDSVPGLTPDLDQAVSMCKAFKEYAVELNSPVLLINHFTKGGDMAGLMALQHEVDTTMMFTVIDEIRRDLSGIKNRYGPIRSITLDMTGEGLILGLPGEDEDKDEDDE